MQGEKELGETAERFRLISVYEGKVSDRMKWAVSGGC